MLIFSWKKQCLLEFHAIRGLVIGGPPVLFLNQTRAKTTIRKFFPKPQKSVTSKNVSLLNFASAPM